MNIRLANTNDVPKICKFLDSEQYKRDIEFWVWMHKIWSSEESISIIAENDDKKVVGHYAIIIQKLYLSNQTYRIGLGLHAITHEDFRKDVSIWQISSLAYKIAQKRGLKFIYGFPNQNIRAIQKRLERWTEVKLFNAFVLDLTYKAEEPLENELSFEAIENADAGDIYLQEFIQFNGNELLPELKAKQGQLTIKLILMFLELYPNIQGKKQSGKETFYTKRTAKDSELDLNKTVEEQFNLLRICDNERYPAFFVRDGIKYILKIEKES